MSEILNRREKISASNLPPEIPDVDDLITKNDLATASKAGIVKVGNNINVASGKISVPVGSAETAGVFKVGENLTVDENGALNAEAGGLAPVLLAEGSGSLSDNFKEVALTDDYDKYTMIVVCVGTSGKNSTAAAYFFVPWLSTGSLQDNVSYAANYQVTIRCVTENSEITKNKLNIKTNVAAPSWNVYGI